MSRSQKTIIDSLGCGWMQSLSWLLLTFFLVDLALAQSWVERANMPAAREKVGTCVIGSDVYVIGGATAANQPGLNTNERYDAQADSWTSLAPMPTARSELTAAAAGGKCYAIGGSAGAQSRGLSVVEVYDPETNQWSSAADMPTARFFAASAVIDGIIYVVGGAEGFNSILDTLEAYDPDTGSWRILTPMPTPRFAAAATALDGKLYVVGGTEDPLTQRFSTVEVYDPSTDQWSTAASMPMSLATLGAEAAGGMIYVVGGSNASNGGVNFVNIYNPAVNRWSAGTPLPSPRSLHGTASVPGEVLTLGGALSTVDPHPAVASVFGLSVPTAQAPVPINVGMVDAWYDPTTSGQGFFVTVFPEIEIVFVAWFTYDTARPAPDVTAVLGEPGHRWLTAQGPYANGVAVLDVVMTSGGVFDSSTPAVTNDGDYGSITIEWSDCGHATLEYDLVVPDLQGTINLQRVVPERASLCEALATQ